ncbi:hypothetical protein [Cryptosporangium sp. NPDC051539]|uniref:hypothetical protein n=1 Tax=Cryptosporangium sp. NPDC051539 TaxID=3363962 RepID=UPI00378E8011
MNDALVSGSIAIVGTAIGWALSEAGAGWRRRSERRNAARDAADGRVFDAVRSAGTFAEGVRTLIGIDLSKATHGEGVTHHTYERIVVDLQAELRGLRLTYLAITAKGPRETLPAATELISRAQQLWTTIEALPRREIPGAAPQLLRSCDELFERARTLAATIAPPR